MHTPALRSVCRFPGECALRGSARQRSALPRGARQRSALRRSARHRSALPMDAETCTGRESGSSYRAGPHSRLPDSRWPEYTSRSSAPRHSTYQQGRLSQNAVFEPPAGMVSSQRAAAHFRTAQGGPGEDWNAEGRSLRSTGVHRTRGAHHGRAHARTPGLSTGQGRSAGMGSADLRQCATPDCTRRARPDVRTPVLGLGDLRCPHPAMRTSAAACRTPHRLRTFRALRPRMSAGARSI